MTASGRSSSRSCCPCRAGHAARRHGSHHGYRFVSHGLIIDGDDAHGVDLQLPWEPAPRRDHDAALDVAAFFVDVHPVTCAQFAAFLAEHGYSPHDDTRFLANWARTPSPAASAAAYTPPAGYDKKPVTYVSIADARAYCAAYGKRLPRAWEWSLAAGQAVDGRTYPWGSDEGAPGQYFPAEVHGHVLPGPADVDAHPEGVSPHGVADLVGNVWQYTDEFSDRHTRSVLVRGGCNYRPAASAATSLPQLDGWSSDWYFPQAKRIDQHNKYFLMDDAYERAGTLGFRCAQDVAGEAQTCWTMEGRAGVRECV